MIGSSSGWTSLKLLLPMTSWVWSIGSYGDFRKCSGPFHHRRKRRGLHFPSCRATSWQVNQPSHWPARWPSCQIASSLIFIFFFFSFYNFQDKFPLHGRTFCNFKTILGPRRPGPYLSFMLEQLLFPFLEWMHLLFSSQSMVCDNCLWMLDVVIILFCAAFLFLVGLCSWV